MLELKYSILRIVDPHNRSREVPLVIEFLEALFMKEETPKKRIRLANTLINMLKLHMGTCNSSSRTLSDLETKLAN